MICLNFQLILNYYKRNRTPQFCSLVCMIFVVQQQLQLRPTARPNGFHTLLVNSQSLLDDTLVPQT